MLIKDAELVPNWLKEYLVGPCPYCGYQYEVGYSPNSQRVTKHYCPNRYCPGTVAMKMVFVWTVLKVEGIKFGRSIELIKKYKIKNHMESIPHIIKGKPRLDLTTFMRLNCIQGIDDSWGLICEQKDSVEGVLQTPIAQKLMSPEDIRDVMNAVQYVELIYPEKQEFDPVVRMAVMMTGDILELSNREVLVTALNKKYKGLLDLRYSKNKRKTGVSVLIKEEGSAITGKTTIAIENGIPVMTSREFIFYIDKLIKERAGDKYNDI